MKCIISDMGNNASGGKLIKFEELLECTGKEKSSTSFPFTSINCRGKYGMAGNIKRRRANKNLKLVENRTVDGLNGGPDDPKGAA